MVFNLKCEIMVKYFISVPEADGWRYKTTRKAEAKKYAIELLNEGCEYVDFYAYSKQYGPSYQGTAYSVEDVTKW